MEDYIIIRINRNLARQLMLTIDVIMKSLDPDKVKPVHFANLRILGNELQQANGITKQYPTGEEKV